MKRGKRELGTPTQWSQRRAGVPPVEATGVGLGAKGARERGDITLLLLVELLSRQV
jgi:hypothetical protein